MPKRSFRQARHPPNGRLTRLPDDPYHSPPCPLLTEVGTPDPEGSGRVAEV